ncbi:hypothetical protein P167DRAFT_610131 [Morchella conica CCBAS932]|uniref:Uncharacterized protein n=1 Tax=Morchella conica CCBAS932 TaxID=1392247 RepID=A0A3N4KA66_9PEZI|nr:hypothetical protein P167DRAFT_610131 [Morchella conica CCBAS932]
MAAPPPRSASPPPPQPTVLIPLKVDAFALNSVISYPIENHPSLIAPITQPNYTFLRLSADVLQPDIVPFTDLHTAGVNGRNPRLYDLGANTIRENRVGVYLTWLIPRVYRAGSASTKNPPPPPSPSPTPSPTPTPTPPVDNSAPSFISAPVRWLVVRVITDATTILPTTAQTQLPLLQAWVIESDRKRLIDDLDATVDLQTDVSPFIDPGGANTDPDISTQAEVFIGYRADASGWKEDPDASRVPLCLVNSANHLFADFQPHNGNVFSMCDGFDYVDAYGNSQKAENVTASYYVLGWHSDPTQDLFYVDPAATTPPNHTAVLEALNMVFPPAMAGTPDVTAFMDEKNTAGTRLLCHGAIYDVEWDHAGRPTNTPADDQGMLLAGDMPVAVGTTPLDALLAYVAAHKDDAAATHDVKELENHLFRLQALLLAQSDSVDDVRQAADELSAGNYVRTKTGTQYHFAVAGDGGAPAGGDSASPMVPTQDNIDTLRTLNQNSYAYDMAAMAVERKRWELFGVWWEYVGLVKADKGANQPEYTKRAGDLSNDISKLEGQMNTFQQNINTAMTHLSPLKVKAAATPPAFQTRDPTLIVGGIESGWPVDYLKKLVVRLQSEIVTTVPSPPPQPAGWADFSTMVASKMPTAELTTTAAALLNEFLLLHGCDTPPLPWEVEYTHIPYDGWALEEKTSRGATHAQLRWAISDDYMPLYNYDTNTKINPKGEQLDDKRTLSGRVLILPQPNFSLVEKLEQLFKSTPHHILNKVIKPPEQKKLLDTLWELPFLSAPLSGLTDHLLTLVQGTHIKPLVRRPKAAPTPLAEAVKAATKIGFTPAMMSQIGKNTDLTPYGSLVQFLGSTHCAFKPVTHGQMRFTKLNIIDRFGQAISAIDPSQQTPPPLYPAISDFYAPAMLPDGTANGITQEAAGVCEYIQLPPAINQPARLSSWFLMENEAGTDWRPAAEWENPIWGWIVINYPDRGIQLFTTDGMFYTEVRLGGQDTGTPSPKWLPFPPPTAADARIDQLAAQMQSDQEWLESFMAMISEALSKAPAAPTAYAEFLTAIVGKPLALTAMGWSLELTTDALTQQSTLNNNLLPERYLLTDPKDPGRKTYTFPVKLGDANRSYDGLVGYFLPPAPTPPTPPPSRLTLDLSAVHSFFGAGGKAVVDIDSTAYPSFAPFWPDPSTATAADIDTLRTANMSIFGAIVDPFAPVHAYSSFLPPAALVLPPWTWQGAMDKMTAFFRVGPVLLTGDVPPWTGNESHALAAGYDLAKKGAVVPGAGVGVPVGVAEWAWLQPYVQGTGGGEGFLPLGIEKTDGRPRFEGGPYTAVEGYLQLRAPAVGGNAAKTGEKQAGEVVVEG